MDEPSYLTYKAVEEGCDLAQGDILQPNERLNQILEEVHPHFHDDRYTAFLVLTQTCDLVRRDGAACKSPYINLAVVRPVEDVLLRLLDQACTPVQIQELTLKGVYESESKQKACELLGRIFNQNEQALGLFYLHPDTAVGIAEPSVAWLQVSFAVRAFQHYTELINARTGRLEPEFQSKLGWLTGNLFSRVATRDMEEDVKIALTRDLLATDPDRSDSPKWLSRSQVETAREQQLKIDPDYPEQALERLVRLKVRRPRDIAIERVMKAMTTVLGELTAEQRKRIEVALRSDDRFKKACRE